MGSSEIPGHLKTRRRHLIEHFGETAVLSLDEKKPASYIEERRARKKAPATINRELELLRRGVHLAAEARKISWAPKIPRLRVMNARRGFFEEADFEAVARRLPPEFENFARFGYWTGMRKGEIASLAWADVDRDARVLRLRAEHAKNQEGRVIPLVYELDENGYGSVTVFPLTRKARRSGP